MAKFFGVIFLLLLALVTIGILVVLYFVRKGIKFFTRFSSGDLSDEDFKRMSDKYYSSKKRDSVQFDDDYFKGTANKSNRKKQERSQQQQRTTRTADGVTIVDNRDPNTANKKIFAQDEGEYVEFTEE